VAFQSGGKVYRATWSSPATSVTITIPTGDYSSVTNAVLFAGRKGAGADTSLTLLGIGKITAPSNGMVATTTTSITFTALPLTSTPTNGSGSSFAIFTDSNTPGYTGTPISGYPVFDVDGNKAYTNTTSGIRGQYKISCSDASYFGAVKLASSPWTVTSAADNSSTSISEGTLTYGPLKQASVAVLSPTNAANGTVDGEFTFSINTSSIYTGDYIKIYIDVPVVPISTAAGDTATLPSGYTGQNETAIGDWRIRGGYDNTTLDNGTTGSANKGGAVLLKVISGIAPGFVTPTVSG